MTETAQQVAADLLRELNDANFDNSLFVYKKYLRQLVDRINSVSGGPSTLTATMTTDPNTFEATHVFDLGSIAVAYVTATVIAANADGVEWGHGDDTDDGAGRIATDIQNILVSRDNIKYTNEQGSSLSLSPTWIRDQQYRGEGGFVAVDDPGQGVGFLPFLSHEMMGVVGRYIKVKGRVCDSYSLNTYAGVVKHPTTTFRLDVEYV